MTSQVSAERGPAGPVAGTDYTISLTRANLAGIPLFLAIMAAVVLPRMVAGGFGPFIAGIHPYAGLVSVFTAIAIGTVAHEFFHGLGWTLVGRKRFGAVRFGFHWKTITPYAHFTEPITAWAYRVGIVLPGILVGIGPAIAGYVLDEPALILFGGMFSGAASGDLLSLWATRKIPAGTPVMDHPSRVGCYIPGAGQTADGQ